MVCKVQKIIFKKSQFLIETLVTNIWQKWWDYGFYIHFFNWLNQISVQLKFQVMTDEP